MTRALLRLALFTNTNTAFVAFNLLMFPVFVFLAAAAYEAHWSVGQ